MKNLSLKLKFTLINILIILSIMLVSTLVSIHISRAELSKSNKTTSEEMEKSLNIQLIKASEIALNILEDKKKQLGIEANIMSNNEDLKEFLAYGVISTSSPKKDLEKAKIYNKMYKQSKRRIDYMKMGSRLRDKFYRNIEKDTPREIEIVNEYGKLKGWSSGFSSELRPFKEKANSSSLKMIIEADTSFSDLITRKEGLVLKMYKSVVLKERANVIGGITLSLPLNLSFATQLKAMTKMEVLVYNEEKFLTGTFLHIGEKLGLIKQEKKSKIFKNIKAGSEYEIENVKLRVGKNLENYRLIYVPLKNLSKKVVGMLALASPTKELEKTMAKFENEKKQVSLKMVKNLSGVSIIGIIIGIILVYLISSNLTSRIEKIELTVEDIAEGHFEESLKVESNDELGKLSKNINVMANKLDESFKKEKEYRRKIEEFNKNLEKKVIDRTRKINNLLDEVNLKNEELTKLNKLKDDFLANTSHELKTPLNGIIGIAESLIEGVAGDLNKKLHKNLTMIAFSGKRLSSLVNDILDFSKMKTKDLEIDLKTIDIGYYTSLISDSLKPLLKNKNVKLVNELKEGTYFVLGDESKLQQIIYNLLGNAIKFTKEGEILISVEKNNEFLEFSIKDSGIGIAKDKQESIFNEFEQGDGSTAREYGGTGLGLSISKKLVELHKGKIWVDSEKGQGSKFSFSLLLSDKKLEVKKLETKLILSNIDEFEEEIEIISSSKNDKSILIVDDEAVNLSVLSNYLSLKDYNIDTANGGKEALEKIKEKKYDLLILDVMMPKITGYDICKEVRKDYSMHEYPILLLTAKNRPEDVEEGFRAGTNDYLTKPIEKKELFARVDTLVSLKTAVKSSIENAKKYEKEKQQRFLSEELSALNKSLSTTLVLKDVLSRFFEKIKIYVNQKKSYVFLKEGNQYNLWKNVGNDFKKFNARDFVAKNTHLYKKLKQEKKVEEIEEMKIMGEFVKKGVVFPIILRNNLMGVILFKVEENMTSDNKNLVFSLCNQLAFAIENARLFEKNQNKTRDLIRSNKSVKNLLNNAGQGFLYFGKSLNVEKEYSYECEKIFEKEINNENIVTLVYKEQEKKDYLTELFNDIFLEEKKRKVKSYFKLLPKEFIINNKNIKVDYKLIENIHNEKEIMFILSDITEKRNLQVQIEKEKAVVKMLVKAIVNYEYFSDFVREFKRFFNEILDKLFLGEMVNKEIIAIFFRQIHTFKGNFSQIGMVDIVEKLNNCEDLIYNQKEELELMKKEELKSYIKGLKIEDSISHDMELLENMLGKDFFNKENIINIDKKKLIDLEKKIEELIMTKEKGKLISKIRKLRYKSLKTMIKPYENLSLELVKKLNKVDIEFEIKGDDIFIEPEKYNDFLKTLVHVFRNIIDHGLELEEERKKLNKSEKASIICELSLKEDYAELTISDDGRGINLEKLRVKAIENGYYSKEKLARMSKEEIAELIFKDDMSTSEKLSDISGRGVGMSAVKYELEKLNGNIQVESEVNKGTKFIMKFPKLLMEV